MSDDLKPCPFCGNGSLLVIARRASIYPLPDVKVFEGSVLCEECGGAMLLRHKTRSDTPDDIGVGEVRDVLRERWNARAQRTCHIRYHGGTVSEGGMEAEDWYYCAACGEELPKWAQDAWDEYEFHDFEGAMPFRHCPECGAKIVSPPDGTCRMIKVSLYDEEGIEGIECDVCEWSDMHDWCDPMPDRCPGCKRKVVV
ncbi:Lar family restriction alleviation protein [uncultured Adlercreutzia sp.]|uniref:Lar family restriction alleviation protein n=1 Tax=uncultured Adlercreutzia sp. TaxID=875803 RepID=UPI00266D299A|nr:Lar family restriction alleviation protein [uncultured Adlercreutzia sp.]